MYLYETHLHTVQASACGRSFGREYIKPYQDLGYTGIFVTDHFMGGNCAVERSLPWKEFVYRFCAGFEDARNEGAKHNFQVFFGWEETFDGDDFLVYGLTPEWLLEHPEVRYWTRKEQYDAVHAQGGCVVQAHPFRERDYISTVHLSPKLSDAFEVVNIGNTPQQDASARKYAQKHGLRMTAGTDIHSVTQVTPELLSGMAFEKPLRDIQDYVRAVQGQMECTLIVPPGREFDGEPPFPFLPVDVRDENDRSIPVPNPLF